ncbi:MAG TPA: HD domain-containing phosphohydrolase [Nocardioides sp.]|nr:HD domain-containing phosphohydrolase [Nocardioides sp.]
MTTTSASGTSGTEVCLADLLGALSLGVDLGFGQPMEHVLRQTVIALRLGDHLALERDERSTIYFTSLLVNVACHTDAHEQVKWFGDDIALRSTKYRHDFRSARGALSGLRSLGAGNPPLHRLRVAVLFAAGGHRELDGSVERHAELAAALALRLGLGARVEAAVAAAYERWDGRGWPGRLRGGDIPIAARICQLAEYVEVAHRTGGVGAAVALARDRAAGQFDPRLTAILEIDAPGVLAGLETQPVWETVIGREPELNRPLRGASADVALRGIADYVDLKSPYTLGHSGAVADLAEGAGRALALSEPEVEQLRRAALLHDLGRLGVSTAIWDKTTPLGTGEWERIRMYPYLTDRILRQSTSLAPLRRVAASHRERLDGSGYPHGLTGSDLTLLPRVLAAADAYQTWREPRPHRAMLTAEQGAARLRTEARAGRLDGDAVEAVLSAAGHRTDRRHSRPAGLSRREIDVLRLIARGMSSREIAADLALSPKTVRNHTEHIYAKTGAGNRVAASLFAVEHGLLPVE